MSQAFHDILRASYQKVVPHVGELGITLSRVDAEAVEGMLPYRPEFLGDVERQLIHTGVITTLIDSICGVALLAHLGKPGRIVTLDLRVDYLRASRPGKTLVCRAECYRLTEQIAFLRASVWQDDPAEPVANGLGAFMRVAMTADPATNPVLGGPLR
jgi:uncharacterized protein (TIGR00369 family)